MTINELRSTPPGTKQYLDAQLLAIGLARTVPTQRGQRNVQELEVVDQQGVRDGLDQVCFAKTDRAVHEERIVGLARGFGYGERCGVGEVVAWAHNEVLE